MVNVNKLDKGWLIALDHSIHIQEPAWLVSWSVWHEVGGVNELELRVFDSDRDSDRYL